MMESNVRRDQKSTGKRRTFINEWIKTRDEQDQLRLITCGSVDDGKSTLIGHLLWKTQQIFEDQKDLLLTESKKHGTQGDEVDFALLVDGLSAEREQGITIDVAYRFFSTPKRRIIIADTPGHEEYTRNMVTGASTADLAIILVDARKGILPQTMRHALIVSLLGISNIVLAINKLDLVNYSQRIFEEIQADFEESNQDLKFKNIVSIPMSALHGDNIVSNSANTSWYRGPTLLGYLDTFKTDSTEAQTAIFPIQWVNRSTSDFRGLSGTISSGHLKRGQKIIVNNSKQTANILEIVTLDKSLEYASRNESVTLVLDREIDASRGDIISEEGNPLKLTDQLEATLIWLHEEPGLPGRSYHIKLANQWASASITKLKYKVNVNTRAHEPCGQMNINDIVVSNLSFSKAMVFDIYDRAHEIGQFILVDKFSNETVAAGLIRHDLRRAHNIHAQKLSISRADKERLNKHRGGVIWLTGLSGSGKTTIANELEKILFTDNKHTIILDGDNIRTGLNKDLGFTDPDRIENIRRLAEVAKLMVDAGLIVIVASISPFRADRLMAKELIGTNLFAEVFLDTPLEICEKRDPKDLYKKSRSGEIPNMTGINSAYEPPLNADIIVKHGDIPLNASAQNIVDIVMRKFNS
jgi:bifunctional enzyme CysN/CysC